MIRTRNILPLLLQWIYRIVHSKALAWILVILIDDRLSGQLRYTHDTVSIVHTILLDGINGRVYLTTATVEIGSMHVNAQWFTTHPLGMNTSRESQPVVSMDNIKFLTSSYHTGNDAIVVDLVVEIGWITTSKIHTSEVVDIHIVEVGIDMIAITEIVIRIHNIAYSLLYVIMIDITPGDRHTIHGHNLTSTAVLITERMRKTEYGFNVTLGMQTLRNTKVSSSQTTKYMRRILPSKH